MEGDDRKGEGAPIELTIWPGARTIKLGRVDFHGRWVDWNTPNDHGHKNRITSYNVCYTKLLRGLRVPVFGEIHDLVARQRPARGAEGETHRHIFEPMRHPRVTSRNIIRISPNISPVVARS